MAFQCTSKVDKLSRGKTTLNGIQNAIKQSAHMHCQLKAEQTKEIIKRKNAIIAETIEMASHSTAND